MNDYLRKVLLYEPSIGSRVTGIRKRFNQLYGSDEDIIIRSPGRAEIIGNHTDYNQGYTLSAAISKSILMFLKKRNDKKIRIFSEHFPENDSVEFEISKDIPKDKKENWPNYARGVVQELAQKFELIGADIYVDSNLPIGQGVSASAAFELALVLGMLTIIEKELDPLEMALLAQRAENDYVGSPCGFLDQGTIAFGKTDEVVFMDYRSSEDKPVKEIKNFNANIQSHGTKFVVAVDNSIERELGNCGYPKRRKTCEESINFWKKKLDHEVNALRDVTIDDFEKYKKELDKKDSVMRKRCEHIVYENKRVLDALKALEDDDIDKFGELLTKSGESALELYDLDEKVPELTFVYEKGKEIDGVVGFRNMGGGFAVSSLGLIQAEKITSFKEELSKLYKDKFDSNLEFIEFNVTEGVGVIFNKL